MHEQPRNTLLPMLQENSKDKPRPRTEHTAGEQFIRNVSFAL